MNSPPTSGPGAIVIAESALFDLLDFSGAQWNLQARQPSIAAMWDALSGGRLDKHSRILVFSDSLRSPTSTENTELVETARAIVAMSHAGARVFVALWHPERVALLQGLIASSAVTQGIIPESLTYHLLPASEGGRAVLDFMRQVLAGDVAFPASWPPVVDGRLTQDAFTPPPSRLPLTDSVAPAGPIIEPALPSAATDPGTPVAADPTFAESPAVGRESGAAPEQSPDVVPEPVQVPPIAVLRGGRTSVPSLPPMGGTPAPSPSEAGYPDSASMELLLQPKRQGQVTITVTSSKGGSGKSTASILLAGSIARASAESGHPLSVCVIDLDTRDGQIASLIGKFMPTALNIRVQPVWDEERIRRNLVRADGLEVDCLLAPIRPRTANTVGPDFFRTIVRSLQRMYDVVVMDTSVQYLEPLIADVAMREADEILFVTTLASTAVQGMARALREITAPADESGLGVPREKIGILVNQSLANVGMERDQVLAAGLGVPVVGVVPLATKDVLTATNLNRMHALLDHPLIGPAYNELARACLPGRDLAPWHSNEEASLTPTAAAAVPEESRPRGLFRR